MSEKAFERSRDGFTISADPGRLDVPAIHAALTRSYWATGIPEPVVRRSIEGSLCFGVYQGSTQIGFARVVTDRATFAYLGDVYVLEEFRGQGLGTWLVQVVLEHPDLAGLRRFLLVTRDAHGLYARFSFAPLASPERYMERHDPDVYRRSGSAP